MSTSSPNIDGQAPSPESLGAVQEVFLRPADQPREEWLSAHFTSLVLDHMREKQCDGFQAMWVDENIEAVIQFKLVSVKKLK